MSGQLFLAVLLAQRSRMDRLSDAFRDRDNPVDKSEIAVMLAVLAGAIALIWLLTRLLARRGRGYHSPRRLFLSLCRAHRLPWSDRWLLWRLARAQRLKDPGRLFLEPERFDEAKLGPAWRAQAARLRAVRQRLFAEKPRGKTAGQTRHKETPTSGAAAGQPASGPTPLLPTPPPPVLDIGPWTESGGTPVGTH